MRAPISAFLTRSIDLLNRTTPLSTGTRHLCAVASPEARTKKLERIADDLLKLNRIELYDYSILFSHKLGLNRYGSVSVAVDANASGSTETKTAEKTAFDVKLEKFEAAVKIKVIKEIRSFTELGMKEAKDLVEKAPVVVKKGLTKEEAEKIMEKLKAVGAIVALE
ncbi:Large ribosomal subunit protein bL12c [Cardamine amara subsp. amara]|uniref:Large ribosomal subunit protein bL12c n=1 Tax=Cardamine amara subsp. amara TaxID=228776 RepID=A0ABD0Z6U6_CARAN